MEDSEVDVFATERNLLRDAKSKLSSGPADSSEWERQYRDLLSHYEKLLDTARKYAGISTLRERMLEEKEKAIRIVSDHLNQTEGLRRQLIEDISHELGTPMTTVQGYVEALIDGIVQPDPRYFRMIHSRLMWMNRLISDLFHLTTLRANQIAFHYKETPWHTWIKSIPCKYSLEAAQKGLQIQIDKPLSQCDRWVLRIDPVRIDQVLANFVQNAIKFTPKGGSIHIRCEALRKDLAMQRFEPHLSKERTYTWEPLNGYVAAIQVTDTGCGVCEEDLPHLFERFFRGKQAKQSKEQGAGLGLAISKEIIRRHDGEIGAISQSGLGSTFFFLLPLQERTNWE